MAGSSFGRDSLLLVAGFLLLALLMWVGDSSPVTPEERETAIESVPQPVDSSAVEIPADAVDNSVLLSWGVPRQLLIPVTRDFNDVPLRDVVDWMQNELDVDMRLDEQTLEEEGIDLDWSITDSARGEPLFVVLNRIYDKVAMGWYERDGIITITSELKADETLKNVTYDVGDLMRAGYLPRDLITTIMNTTNALWEEDGDGEGIITFLNEKLSVMQTDKAHFEVADLLNKLRAPARRTFVADPPIHDVWRRKLQQPVDAAFQNVPLNQALERLAKISGVDLRIDDHTLEVEGIVADEPIDYSSGRHALRAVLDVMLEPVELTYIMRHGVVLITTKLMASDIVFPAVYDVRDIASDGPTSRQLERLVTYQTHGLWEADGYGVIAFPKPGVMVVLQTEAIHEEILELLQRHRAE